MVPEKPSVSPVLCFQRGRLIYLTKKQVKILLCVIQTALVVLLFLPATQAGSDGPVRLNAVDLAHRYADMGHSADSGVYFFFSLCCPVVSFLSLFMLHERSNFGLGACLSAMDLLVQGCFYTAVKESMTGSVALTGLLPFLVFIALFAMGLEIYGYLLAGPSQSPKGGK